MLIEQQDVMKALGRIDKTTLVERYGVNVARNVVNLVSKRLSLTFLFLIADAFKENEE